MLKFAVCDDEESELCTLSLLLSQYETLRNQKLCCLIFQSPFELLAMAEKGVYFDVILLDIVMLGLNGIETAKELRKYNQDVKIIFLTYSAEYAVKSYEVNAFYYQLKPITDVDFFPILDRVIHEIEKKEAETLIIKCRKGIVKLEICQLEYCEIVGRTIFFHLRNGSIYESSGTMQSLSDALMVYPCFLKVHRSYLVNMDYVNKITYKGVELECQVSIPIPAGKVNQVKDTFLKYSFPKQGEYL